MSAGRMGDPLEWVELGRSRAAAPNDSYSAVSDQCQPAEC